MSKITEAIQYLNSNKRIALIPYIVGGYPDEKQFVEVYKKVCDYGDVIEIGIPFSDPLADGPVIQKATAYALKHGINLEKIVTLISSTRTNRRPPVVLMAYYNSLYTYGLTEFAVLCRDNGISGVIVPDLPVEEAEAWKQAASEQSIDTIFLVAPNSSQQRKRLAVESSSGFVYCVSVTGVTGQRQAIPPYLKQYLASLRAITDKPLALGFGISEPEQVKEASNYCNAVIVGSALVNIINPQAGIDQNLGSIDRFLGKLRTASAL